MTLSKLNFTATRFRETLERILERPVSVLAVVCALSIVGSSTQCQLLAQLSEPIEQKPVVHKQATRKPVPRKTAPRKTAPPQKPVAPPANSKKKDGPPAPENMILDTSDGVKLVCTYFESPRSKDGDGGQSVVPVILLHDWDGDRRQLLEFAEFLQSVGHAAIVPDLRGHGESTQVAGVEKPIDATKFRKGEITSAIKDIERCKKYLVRRHNEGKLNIDLLTVVAVGGTSVLAVQWTLNDWYAFPPYSPKGIKQGQDLKALLLVSPEKKLSGVSMVGNLKHPLFTGTKGPALPMLLLWGGSDEMAKDAESIFKTLEKSRPDLSKIESKSERAEKTTLFSVPVMKSQFSGVELMKTQRVNGLWGYIEKTLINRKIVANADKFPWKSRDPDKQ